MRECKCVGSIYMQEVLDQKKKDCVGFGGKVCALDKERSGKKEKGRICAALFRDWDSGLSLSSRDAENRVFV